jgi:signal transduction histidine kinase
LDFHTELPGVAVPVVGDRGALRRLLLILIDNAVKYTSEGKVTVRLMNQNGGPQIEVTDAGLGISNEDAPHIFERFYRADKSRSRDSGGAGLGLAIAKWIVDAHGGNIEAYAAPNGGTTFTVSLPRTRSA